jgi:hypothetical protein
MRKSLRFAATATATFTLGLCGQSALAKSIGVNFSDDQASQNGDSGIQNSDADSLSVLDIAGAPAFAQPNWNNYGRWGNLTPSIDNTGATTGVQFAWDSVNTWRTGVGFGDANFKLMNGYIDSNGVANSVANSPYGIFGQNENKPVVYATGLSAWLAGQGATSYSLVVYVDGDTADGRTGEYWAQAASGGDVNALTLGADLTPHLFVKDTANFNGIYTGVSTNSTSSAGAETGNYVVFTGLTADSFLLRTEEGAVRAPINGFQIVAAVPEPASFSLLGLSVAGLLGLRRRRG